MTNLLVPFNDRNYLVSVEFGQDGEVAVGDILEILENGNRVDVTRRAGQAISLITDYEESRIIDLVLEEWGQDWRTRQGRQKARNQNVD